MPLSIGWSAKSITPDKPVMLQGQFHRRISTHAQRRRDVLHSAVSTSNLKPATRNRKPVTSPRYPVARNPQPFPSYSGRLTHLRPLASLQASSTSCTFIPS